MTKQTSFWKNIVSKLSYSSHTHLSAVTTRSVVENTALQISKS